MNNMFHNPLVFFPGISLYPKPQNYPELNVNENIRQGY
jgi:hypothetical protein